MLGIACWREALAAREFIGPVVRYLEFKIRDWFGGRDRRSSLEPGSRQELRLGSKLYKRPGEYEGDGGGSRSRDNERRLAVYAGDTPCLGA